MIHKREATYSILVILLALILVAGLVYIALKTINPTKFLDKTRDATRGEDLQKLQTALDLYIADGKNFNTLNVGEIYISDNKTENNGQGWLPINFNLVSSGAPIEVLPTDPLNQGQYIYQVGINLTQKTYEIDCRFESNQYQSQAKNDGGNNPNLYEIGTDLTILK